MTKPGNFLRKFIKLFKSCSDEDARKEEDEETIGAREKKLFSLEAPVAATQDFNQKNKLGEGGFGPVYKGKLKDGREIAVKKLSRSSKQGKDEFMNEARLLAQVQHRNVVSLLGYCAHGAEKLLVYEYVANESLDKLLFRAELPCCIRGAAWQWNTGCREAGGIRVEEAVRGDGRGGTRATVSARRLPQLHHSPGHQGQQYPSRRPVGS
ncbi:cysteine-rich receptor-like protein kinase 43 isoform X2 [Tasmannia lanceolata]|uniref:cysteine-rich receptor-like protein kinase 43 isoform X2 n=1 Tax=Tasmannia lanceolata TaxID=3420 RepID=UPI004063AB17